MSFLVGWISFFDGLSVIGYRLLIGLSVIGSELSYLLISSLIDYS